MIGSLPCCAPTANGHAAAVPSAAMKSRRRIVIGVRIANLTTGTLSPLRAPLYEPVHISIGRLRDREDSSKRRGVNHRTQNRAGGGCLVMAANATVWAISRVRELSMNLHDVVSRLAVVVAVSGVAFAAAPANAQYYYGGCGYGYDCGRYVAAPP